MAKARKKADPAAKAAKAARNAQAKVQSNPFELKGVRRHFAVVGQDRRRGGGGGANAGSGGKGASNGSGGGSINVVKARENADLRRKKTLLVEYRQIRRGNAFMDRRLGARMGGGGGGEDGGEGDDDDPAARALQKLRAQRVRESRRGASKFALGGGDGSEDEGGGNGFLSLGASASLGGGKKEVLTHGGRPLDEDEDGGGEGGGGDKGADGFLRRRRADDEEDERLLDELAREYRAFGGPGLDDEDYAAALEGARQQLQRASGAGAGGAGGDASQQQKTRKQVMEEVISKSKAFKAERARQREADEEELKRLNDQFTALVRGEVAPAGGDADAANGSNANGSNANTNPLAPLMLRPGEAKRAASSQKEDADDYDRAARELALAAGRAAPGERTLTAAERQAQERERLEALERARVARMLARAHGGGDDGAEAAAAAAVAPAGGYAARRKRQRDEEAAAAEGAGARRAEERRPQGPSGDALEDDFCLSGSGSGSDEDDDGSSEDDDDDGAPAAANALEARRRARAAGSDPLQAAFREQAARLAAKYGVGGSKKEDEEDDEDEDEDEDESGSEQSGSSEDSGNEESRSEEEEADDEPAPAPPLPKKKPAAAATPDAGAPEDLPFTPALPQTPEAFLALVRGRPAEHLALAVERVLAFNAAELAADGRRKTQVFFGVLLAHFARLAGERPLPRDHLDALLPPLAALAARVPLYAATAARARLERMRARLVEALSDPLAAGPSRGWLAARQILQLRLLSLLFPTTDRRHAVATPAAALLGEALSRCPVSGPYEAALGCACATLLVDAYTAPAGRLAPEAVAFYASALRAFVPASSAEGGGSGGGNGSKAVDRAERAAGQGLRAGEMVLSRFAPGCLALSDGGKGGRNDTKAAAIAPLDLYELLGGQKDDAEDEAATARRLGESDAFRLSLLSAVCAGARGVARVLSKAEREAEAGAGPAASAGGDLMAAAAAAREEAAALAGGAPEILSPLCAAAAALATSSSSSAHLPAAAVELVRYLAHDLRAQASEAALRRKPLVQRRKLLAAAAAGLPASATLAAAPLAPPKKDYTPRFEQDSPFTKKRDYDPDRERAEAKAARRELARERRGAAREMRRDGAFLAAQRDAEKAQVQRERLESEKRFYSELQAFEGDMRSGGQKGMNQHRKKKK